ncbi:putative zinc finger/helix-turn-helix YgiT family protein [Anoxybacillus vitaminiphilus]|uniref:Putative zinc finger/helix-turn-helix YgiT family protein n=1 Tax=Paranoxybacillus vitaminiphilus TaxID=581036 RepID=A0A327YH89_9BACL|nr:type II TA system antitoxin MqsA family protein [Anoxybacillus vitaminiphilus]RAK19871.1 putative zinc finger/helix-turn-helix YgiT family protein [Anoxybacillus vitaminiphilus]
MAELLEKIHYNCPFCDEEHEISVFREKTKALVNNTPVEYEEIYYYCPIEEDKFVPKEILNQNLLAAKDSYRTLNGLLTSQEIKDIRNSYGLSQKEFANMLGWGDVTIQRYEKKSIQDETYDQKIREVKDNPKLALDELEKHKEKFDQARYEEIREFIKELVKTKSIKYLNKEIIESIYIDHQEESEYNGYKLLDLEKVENMIAFFAQYSSRLYKVKLMKLLWYADALFFKKYGVGMSGLVYKRLPLGAVPKAHEEILKYAQSSINIIEEYFDEKIAYKILPKVDVDLSKFTIEEISVLQTVLEKFDKMGSREISDYMHEELAYQKTARDEVIPYSLAREIRDF